MNPAPSEPNIKPNPTNQNSKEPNMKSTKFLKRMLTVFLPRVKPASHSAKPGCMKKTNIAANNIHTVSSESAISFIFQKSKG